MVAFCVPQAGGPAASVRVTSHAVGFAGSRNGGLDGAVTRALVEGFLHLGFGFLTGCAPGITTCFRSVLGSIPEAAERTIIACAFPHAERALSGGAVFGTTLVPIGLSAAAAFHLRTVSMVRRSNLFGVVDGTWVIPHPTDGGTCDEDC